MTGQFWAGKGKSIQMGAHSQEEPRSHLGKLYRAKGFEINQPSSEIHSQ